MSHSYNNLIDALTAKEFDKAQEVLDSGFDLDSFEGSQRTNPLLHFVGKALPEQVSWLLEKGANPNVVSRNGISPLNRAIKAEYAGFEVLEILLKNGADPNLSTENKRSPLYIASYAGNFEFAADAVELLLRSGADPNQKFEDGTTALMVAASRGTHKKVVEHLIRANADPRIGLFDAGNVMHAALRSHNREVAIKVYNYCRPYIQNGEIDLHQKNSIGNTIAGITASYNGFEPLLLQMFLDGANPNDKNNNKMFDSPTVFMKIATLDKDGSASLVAECLARNGNVFARDNLGRDVMYYTIQQGLEGSREVIEMLVENGYNPNLATSAEGLSPFHALSTVVLDPEDFDSEEAWEQANAELQVNIADYFIGLGFPTLPSVWQKPTGILKRYEEEQVSLPSPVVLSLVTGHVQLADLFLEKGTPLTAVNNVGDAVIHSLAGYVPGKKIDMEKIMEKISDLQQKRNEKAMSDEAGGVSVEKKEKKAEKEAEDNSKKEVQNEVNQQKLQELNELFKKLDEYGVDWNVKNRKGETLLHLAIEAKNLDLIYGLGLYTDASFVEVNEKGVSILEAAWNKDVGLFMAVTGLLKEEKPSAWLEARKVINDIILSSPEEIHSNKYQLWKEKVVYTLAALPELCEVQDADENTPLILAAATGQYQLVGELVSRQVNLNHQNAYGETALLQALCSEDENVSLAQFLYSQGADATIKSEGGTAPCNVADMKEWSREKVEFRTIELNKSKSSKYEMLMNHYKNSYTKNEEVLDSALKQSQNRQLVM